MGTAVRPRNAAARFVITLLATLSLLASQLVLFAVQPAEANTNVPDSLDQWANGSPGQDPAVSGGWQNGNLNANNSQYGEGDSVAFRRELGGDGNRQFTVGQIYRVSLNYDTINSGLVAYDYLTSWDRTEPEANPLLGTGNRYVGANESRLAIPDDPRLANTPGFGQVLAGPREMTAYGADLLFVGNYRYSSGSASQPYSPNGTTTTTVDVVFRANRGAVMLAWGGHIAVQSQWNAGAGYDTAPRNTNGSPYHMRNTGSVSQLQEDLTTVISSSNAGNQDRSIKASAILVPGLNLSKGVLDPGGFERNDDDQIIVGPGDEFTYTLTVTNTGEAGSTLQTIRVSDSVPSIFEIQDVSGASCTTTGQDVVCTIPSLAAGASVAIRIAVKVVIDVTDPAKVCGLYENDAVAASGDLSDRDQFVVDVRGCAPTLDIEKDVVAGGQVVPGARDEATPASFASGDSFVYRLGVTVGGTATATDVVVTDTIELPLVVNTAGLPAGCSYDGATRVVSCSLGDLAPGATRTIDIPVSVPAFDACTDTDNVARVSTSFANVAAVDSNLVYVDIAGCAAAPTYAKTLAPDAASAIDVDGSEQTTFRLSVANAGSATATLSGATIADVIPAGLSYVSLSNTDDCSYDGATRTVSCSVPDLAPGASFSVDVTVEADVDGLSLGDAGTLCGTITNTATFTYDGSSTDRTADVTLEGCSADVSIEKSVDVDGGSIDVGGDDVATYTITVANDAASTATATGVTVTDSVDAAFEIVEVSYDTDGAELAGFACAATGQVVSCGPVDLAPGETLEVTIEVQAAGGTCGRFPNVATVTYSDAGTGEQELSSSTGPEDALVRISGCESRVELDKDVDVDRAITIYAAMSDDEATITYTITATVSGELDAQGIVIADELPAPLVLVGAPTYQVNAGPSLDCDVTSDASFECAVGTASPDDEIVVTVGARVPNGSFDVCGQLDNTATVDWYFVDDLQDRVEDSDEASASFELTGCTDELLFDKSANPAELDTRAEDDANRQVTYTITAWNGPSLGPVSYPATATARDVTITDDLAELIAHGGFSVVGVTVTLNGVDVPGLCTADLIDGLDCDAIDLAPGDELIVALTLQLELTDANNCTVDPLVNVAFVEWTNDDTETVFEEQDDAELDLTGCDADILLDKEAVTVSDADGLILGELVDLGDGKQLLVDLLGEDTYSVVYRFTVTNTGNVTLHNVTLDDPLLGGPLTLSNTTLAPGASATAFGTYEVTEDDIEAGLVPNTATATGEDRPEGGDEVTSTDSDEFEIVELPAPGIDIVKTADVEEIVFTDADDTAVITYTYVITNTGGRDLTDLSLVDDVLGDLTPAFLAAIGGDTFVAGGEVTVEVEQTVGPEDAGPLRNVADVAGTDITGREVTATDDAEVEIVFVLDEVLEKDIAVEKVALVEPNEDGDKVVDVGADGVATITYRYTITNTGDATLFRLTLVDDVIGDLSDLIEVDSLAPGASTVVEVDYETTAADLDRTFVTNVADATGTGADGVTVTARDDETVDLVQVLDVVVPRPLPRTGVDATLLMGIGLLLSALGLAVLLFGPQRRRLQG